MASTWISTKSVELWVKPEGASVTCANSAPGACDYIFGDKPQLWGLTRGIINGQDRIWAFNYDGTIDVISMTYNPNEWVHIALVHNGGMLRLFRNGVEVVSRASGNTLVSGGVNPVLFMGGMIFSSTRNYTLQGQIDEVRLWNIARGAPEIQNDMLHTLTGNEAGLAAYYQMSNGAGSTLTDDSINSWNGTLLDGASGVAPNGTLPQWVVPGPF
jgi:Concanavalin A-like lectin/glucanases superfamily